MPIYKEYQSEWLLELNVHIENNLNSFNFSVTDLAYQMHLSQFSLYRKVKTLTDLSPAEYIKRMKSKRRQAVRG